MEGFPIKLVNQPYTFHKFLQYIFAPNILKYTLFHYVHYIAFKQKYISNFYKIQNKLHGQLAN